MVETTPDADCYRKNARDFEPFASDLGQGGLTLILPTQACQLILTDIPDDPDGPRETMLVLVAEDRDTALGRIFEADDARRLAAQLLIAADKMDGGKGTH